MTDSEGILLSDILPTGFEIGVQYGHQTRAMSSP